MNKVKEWMNAVRCVDREIKELQRERERIYTQLTSTTGNMHEVISKNVSGTKDSALAAYADLGCAIDEQINKLYQIKKERLKVINSVSDTTLRTILIKRYISCETFEQIAVDMNYSCMQIYRLHGKALSIVEKMML